MPLPPIDVVPMFVRCRWCEGVFRASTRWPRDDRTRYRRCAWCARLTKIPEAGAGVADQLRGSGRNQPTAAAAAVASTRRR